MAYSCTHRDALALHHGFRRPEALELAEQTREQAVRGLLLLQGCRHRAAGAPAARHRLVRPSQAGSKAAEHAHAGIADRIAAAR
eukprot:SAG22_NODE_3329_length_1775_cov_6.273866_3_plen_84_part_00